MAGHAVDTQALHAAQGNADLVVTAGPSAGSIRRREFVDRNRVALHALQSPQRTILGLEVHLVAGRVADQGPLLRVSFHVACGALLVLDLRVRADLLRSVQDLLQSHPGPLVGGGVVTGFAREVLVGACLEEVERLLHQVARHAEVVVVLDVVVRPVGEHAERAYGDRDQKHQSGYGAPRQITKPSA